MLNLQSLLLTVEFGKIMLCVVCKVSVVELLWRQIDRLFQQKHMLLRHLVLFNVLLKIFLLDFVLGSRLFLVLVYGLSSRFLRLVLRLTLDLLQTSASFGDLDTAHHPQVSVNYALAAFAFQLHVHIFLIIDTVVLSVRVIVALVILLDFRCSQLSRHVPFAALLFSLALTAVARLSVLPHLRDELV